jgi:8-oxo-dGTP pyrophosphatase MutT (NUDIX family)
MKLTILNEDHFKKAVAIVYDDNANVLLGRATNDGDRKGKWCFPAGHIQKGECPGDAAARECYEETGFEVKPQQMAFAHHMKPSIGFVVCRKISGSAKPNSEFSELRWVPWNKVLELEDLYHDVAEVLRKPIARFP